VLDALFIALGGAGSGAFHQEQLPRLVATPRAAGNAGALVQVRFADLGFAVRVTFRAVARELSEHRRGARAGILTRIARTLINVSLTMLSGVRRLQRSRQGGTGTHVTVSRHIPVDSC
jgi:hypothetical protein